MTTTWLAIPTPGDGPPWAISRFTCSAPARSRNSGQLRLRNTPASRKTRKSSERNPGTREADSETLVDTPAIHHAGLCTDDRHFKSSATKSVEAKVPIGVWLKKQCAGLKACIFSGCESVRQRSFLTGSSRSDDGGNEIVEAFDA